MSDVALTENQKEAIERLKLERDLLAAQLKKQKIESELPHLYGQKMYPWQRRFWECRNKKLFCTAANQIGKSSILIKKMIHWATAQELWPSLWATRPRVFFYLYPSYDLATREFHTKWVPEFLPRGDMKDDPVYGWQAEFDKKQIKAIHFKSGVSLYFLAYAQQTTVMQATTVHAVGADEELPEEHYSEIQFRLIANDGYFMAAFTATLGQEFWREIMEEKGDQEKFPEAHKLQISMFDCMHFEDGSPSHWTKERISAAIAACPNEQEVQRRIYGRFVRAENLRYANYKPAVHLIKRKEPVPQDWAIYCGVDLGSGIGTEGKLTKRAGHAGAITFIAVSPDYKRGRVFKHWNGKGQLTTAADIFNQFLMMRADRRCVAQVYDFAGKDFGTIAARAGEGFMRANKDRKLGDDCVNSLFANNMMSIDDLPETAQLSRELLNLRTDTNPVNAIDDSVDSFRYAAVTVPWDWSFLNPEMNLPEGVKPVETDEQIRRGMAIGKAAPDLAGMMPDEEFSFWQDQYDV